LSTKDKKHPETGSDSKTEPVFFQIGRLQKAHGIRGEIKLNLSINFPLDISTGSKLFIGKEHKPYIIASSRGQLNLLIVSFETISNRETVQRLINKNVYVQFDQLPKQDEKKFYFHEVIGMNVKDEFGAQIGKIREIIETGANDVYVVDPEDGEKEILIPAIKSVVQDIDRKTKTMIIHLPTWD